MVIFVHALQKEFVQYQTLAWGAFKLQSIASHWNLVGLPLESFTQVHWVHMREHFIKSITAMHITGEPMSEPCLEFQESPAGALRACLIYYYSSMSEQKKSERAPRPSQRPPFLKVE